MSASNLLRLLPAIQQKEISSSSLLGPLLYFSATPFVSLLQERLGLKHLSFHLGKRGWLEASELEMPRKETLVSFHAPPISGSAYWSLPQQAVTKLLSWILKEEQEQTSLSSATLAEGFYHYVLLEMLDALTKAPLFSRVSPKISLEDFPKERMLRLEITVQQEKEAVTGWLLFSGAFMESLQQYFTLWEKDLPKEEFYENVPVLLEVTIAKVALPTSSLKHAKPGDVLLPDVLSYNMKTKKGSGIIRLQNESLCKVEIEKNLAVIQTLNPPETIMEDTKDPVDSQSPLEELPLTITVELASIEFSLQKLRELTEGSSFALPDNPSNAVTLRLQGKKIGSGELVALGEDFGVRILSMNYTK